MPEGFLAGMVMGGGGSAGAGLGGDWGVGWKVKLCRVTWYTLMPRCWKPLSRMLWLTSALTAFLTATVACSPRHIICLSEHSRTPQCAGHL